MLHNVAVQDREITILDYPTVVMHNVNVDTITADFDDAWNDCDSISAFFVNGDIKIRMTYSDNMAIPWECLTEPGELFVTFKGFCDDEVIIVTKRMKPAFTVEQCGYCSDGADPSDPTHDEVHELDKRVSRLELTSIGNFPHRETLAQETVEVEDAFPVEMMGANVAGKTTKWNQLVYNGNFADTSGWGVSSGTRVMSDNICTVTPIANYATLSISNAYIINVIATHKYFVSATVKCESNMTSYIGVSTADRIMLFSSTIPGASFKTYEKIMSWDTTAQRGMMFQWPYGSNGVPGSVCKVFIIDLTAIFGAGNEPATVEAFKATPEYRAKVVDGYAPYDDGSIASINTAGIQVSDGTTPHSVSINLLGNEIRGVGSVSDELVIKDGRAKIVKRFDVVDLGTLSFWLEGTGIFAARPAGINTITNAKVLIEQGFNQVPASSGPMDDISKTLNGVLYLRDVSKYGSYTAAEFKAAMSGVMLVYELAEQTEIDLGAVDLPEMTLGYNSIKALTNIPTTISAEYEQDINLVLQQLAAAILNS